MPSIPITPSSIANAGNYDLSQQIAVPTNICKQPSEGAAYVPMSFNFASNSSWLVDLRALPQVKPFSQIASIYVDNTNSSHDVNIFFPDSGYTARVAFGDTAMLNVLTGKISPKFYVILDSGGALSPTDICNVFAINIFIPPFLTSTFARTVAYGYGQMFSLVPTFTQSSYFILRPGFTVLGSGIAASGIIIPNMQWYITMIKLYVWDFTSTLQNTVNVELFDNGALFFEGVASLPGGSASAAVDMVNLSGLNYLSSGNGACSYNVVVSNACSGIGGIALFGGVLVT